MRLRKPRIKPFWGGFLLGITPAIFLAFYCAFPVHNNQYVRMVSYTEHTCYHPDERPPLTTRKWEHKDPNRGPTIYMITPTYRRPQQRPDIVRLAQTLMQVPNFHWIISYDGVYPEEWLSPTLRELNLNFTLITCHRMTTSVRRRKQWTLSKGCVQRNCGLKWLRDNGITEGIVYFGDDDNTYHLRLFEEMRTTKLASMFPVGNLHFTGLSTPIVVNGVIISTLDPSKGHKAFPLDMAGFAVNIKLLSTRNVFFQTIPYNQEDMFLRGLGIPLSAFEPKANNCTEILVWHTRTERMKYYQYTWNHYSLENNNLAAIQKQLVFSDDDV